MKKILLVLAMSLCGTAFAGERVDCRVVGVHDGDTLTCLAAGNRQMKVRLFGIDAPETKQSFGTRAKQTLSDAVYGKQVAVETMDTDRYGRTVGRVLLGGQDINLQQVKQGMAWVYTQYTKDLAYLAAEQVARSAKRGLWAEPNPVRPSDFRHGGGGAEQAAVDPVFKQPVAVAAGALKKFCSQMTSCADAKQALAAGFKNLDGDGDGVPCEKLCRP
ncbi:thermonuclease family protein [Gulbenkiania mobilis]|uniref:thermonuclease family protein n=1 Tax=Gulbenkiania mobilis TaxID=397457 RepID=UPI0006BBA0DA|nr:thermonuclease family protein [Gulbenkiania mobilis]